jgi:hypothetical protein
MSKTPSQMALELFDKAKAGYGNDWQDYTFKVSSGDIQKIRHILEQHDKLIENLEEFRKCARFDVTMQGMKILSPNFQKFQKAYELSEQTLEKINEDIALSKQTKVQ